MDKTYKFLKRRTTKSFSTQLFPVSIVFSISYFVIYLVFWTNVISIYVGRFKRRWVWDNVYIIHTLFATKIEME